MIEAKTYGKHSKCSSATTDIFNTWLNYNNYTFRAGIPARKIENDNDFVKRNIVPVLGIRSVVRLFTSVIYYFVSYLGIIVNDTLIYDC